MQPAIRAQPLQEPESASEPLQKPQIELGVGFQPEPQPESQNDIYRKTAEWLDTHSGSTFEVLGILAAIAMIGYFLGQERKAPSL